MNKTKIFADNLKRYRKNKGFTQCSISQMMSIAVNRYAAWEEGRAKPSLHHLAQLCEILGIDDLYLFISKEQKVA